MSNGTQCKCYHDIYIKNHLSTKTRNDLNIYKSFELESKFIEICNHKENKYYFWMYLSTSKWEH